MDPFLFHKKGAQLCPDIGNMSYVPERPRVEWAFVHVKKLGICENESKNLVIFHNFFIMECGFY